ncbi:MAG: hypothetical protein AB7N80_14995 [Bdellovibrionales bacterium]
MASQLDRWLATLSRGTLATLAISAGILFIIFSDPPHTVCQAQLNFLRDQQKGFLFADPGNKKLARGASFQQMAEYCQRGDGPGACYELFAKMRVLVRDLQSVPAECASQAAAIDEVKAALWGTAKFMTKTAWGKVPPVAYQDKFGWLDVADIALFCGLKAQIIRFYGESDWDSYREGLFRDLPGAKDLQRKNAWEKMILSEDCRRY